MPRNYVKPLPIEELLVKRCRMGHSRTDAYVYEGKCGERRGVVCRTCARLRYMGKKFETILRMWLDAET